MVTVYLSIYNKAYEYIENYQQRLLKCGKGMPVIIKTSNYKYIFQLFKV